jgi:hypothetical protein
MGTEYAAKRARELADCLSEEEANRLIEQVEIDVRRAGLTADQQQQLWREIRRKYEDEPKPFFKETISGRRLNQLQAAVQQFLLKESGG